MSLKLITGPTGSGKTAKAIGEFLAALGRGERPVLMAPSGPDARHFERQILRRLGSDGSPGALTGGKVMTFEGLCRQILKAAEPGVRVLSANERFLLLRAIVDTTENLSYLSSSSSFDGFIQALANIVSELELLGVDSTGMGQALRSWATGNEVRQDLTRDLYRLVERYEAALKDKGIYDAQLAQRRALTLLKEDPARLGFGAVIVDGFWDFTSIQHEIIEVISGGNASLLVTVPHDAGHTAYLAPASHLEKLERIDGAQEEKLAEQPGADRVPALDHLVSQLFQEDAGTAPADGAVICLKGAGSRGQAEMVAAEILNLWREGQNLDEIAVVCRSLNDDMFRIAAVFNELGVPYELPAPLPLGLTEVGRTAAAALDFAAGSRSRASLFTYLRSPLSSQPLDSVDEFDRHCRLNAVEDKDDLLWVWKMRCGPLEELDRLAAAAAEGVERLGEELCRLVQSLLQHDCYVDRASAGTLKIDILALECLTSLCSEAGLSAKVMEASAPLPGAAAAGISEDSTAAAGILLRAIKQATLRIPASTYRRCVRLLDPHRILNQRFDIVFVCGLLEKQFPNLGREDAFFSDADRRELGGSFGLELDSRDRRLDEERFLYFRTLSRARHQVYLCYPAWDKEGKPSIPSLFVEDTLDLFDNDPAESREKKIGDATFAPEEAPTAGQAIRGLALLAGASDKDTRSSLARSAASAGLGERLAACLQREEEQQEGGIRDAGIIERLGQTDTYAVTDLQRYLRCPFRYFVESVLSPSDMEPKARGLKRGTIIHNILCHFGAQLKRSGLYLNDPEIRPGQVDEARRQMTGFIAEEFSDAGSDLDTLILKAELEFHLGRYIDRELASQRPLKYYDFEVSFGSGKSSCGGKNDTDQVLPLDDFKLKGRLDRVDWHGENNYALVIDYKSSKNATSLKDFEPSKEIQIPLYIMALRDAFGLDPIGGEYYALRGEKRGGMYLEGNEELIGAGAGQISKRDIVDREIFDRTLDRARQFAREAAQGIRAGRFPAQPLKNKECDWCNLGSVCRGQSRSESADLLQDDLR